MVDKPIYVTQPSLPPLDDFLPYLREIWDSKILTNCGSFHQRLESALCEYLGVPHISLFCNGTIALITAVQALEIKGEVITTPYSFVATAHSLVWNNVKPIFVDIEPDTFNLNPKNIEAYITPNTSAIMPVHCYGYPCDVEAIDQIAQRHNLKVIYDAAHAFGVRDRQGSVLNYGDLSVLSFHATKVFNTFEGGAIVSHDLESKQRIDRLKNFGIVDEVSVPDMGLNGKMSEINAAFGLLQLDYIDDAIAKRSKCDSFYRELLSDVAGIRCLPEFSGGKPNYSYFPIMVEDDFPISRDELYQKLKNGNVISRRYFFPLIPDFLPYRKFTSIENNELSVARETARKILCLPIYPSLSIDEQRQIVALLKNA